MKSIRELLLSKISEFRVVAVELELPIDLSAVESAAPAAAASVHDAPAIGAYPALPQSVSTSINGCLGRTVLILLPDLRIHLLVIL
jgi:hypothetical protein